MLSKPLAYPSTLDRRRWDARPTAIDVLRGGALEPEARTSAVKNSMLKRTPFSMAVFHCQTPSVFLSQAGPRFGPIPSSS